MLTRRRDEGADLQIVFHAEPRKQAPVFRNVCDPVRDDAMRRNAFDRSPMKRNRAGDGGDESRYHPHQRGLAGAVGADHAHRLAGGNRERYIEQRPERAIAGGDIGE